MANEEIILAAECAHKKHWRQTSNQVTGNSQAEAVTKAWQTAVQSEHIKTEVLIANHLKHAIDVVDLDEAVAYEMKCSGKNAHHEFYKDICKVFVYNQFHEKKLKELVFLTEQKGANPLRQGLGQAITQSGPSFGINITVRDI